jgi:hypothetical protein
MMIHTALVANPGLFWLAAIAIGVIIVIVLLRFFFHLIHYFLYLLVHGGIIILLVIGFLWLLHYLGIF